MQKSAIIGNYFNRMANRMAKIQNRTLPGRLSSFGAA